MPNLRSMISPKANAGARNGMTEATRLIRAGRLNEATALIQRTLGGNPVGSPVGSPTAPDAPPAAWDPASGAGATALGSISLPGLRDATRPREVEHEARTAGHFVSGSYANRAGKRGYRLYVPSKSTGGPMPLLVMLHGCTQSAEDFAAGTRMNALAEDGSFLVVYPEQASSANPQRCWNWFKAGDQRRDVGEPSLIAGITRQVAAEHPVDPDRIYVAGMSAGGAMAVIMGETYPDLFAAVGVHSGLPYGAAHDMPSAFGAMQGGAADSAPPKAGAAGAVPTIVFHGDRDGTVHRRNGDQVVRRWAEEGAGGGAARAAVRQDRVPGGRAYTRSVYKDADGKPVAERWLVHGAGHAWAGGSQRGTYTDPQGPDASAEMVRFFLEHPRK